MVGMSLRQLPDSTYQVVGLVQRNGKTSVEDIEPEDIIISIDGFNAKGETMGTVVDKLRGKPGDIRKIVILRNGEEVIVNTSVEHFL
jgi:C-terminal processing protease CtpA/Prc